VIDVALTGDGARTADVAVVIDVLRATSTATQALAAGYRRVLCVGSIERAAQLRTGDRVLPGEQRCVKPPGFDQGNSPREALDRRGEELVLATTNGAPTIVAARACAPTVLLACLLNLDAVVIDLLQREDRRVADMQIVCSGTDGAVTLGRVRRRPSDRSPVWTSYRCRAGRGSGGTSLSDAARSTRRKRRRRCAEGGGSDRRHCRLCAGIGAGRGADSRKHERRGRDRCTR
jgi:hypothetical protein